MIRITVLTQQGAPAGRPLAAQFGPQGGTIGRAATNTLVLDDPDRTVSRVHAQVLSRNGQFFVIDRGSNPMLSNGRALGAGNEAALASGDRLVIGSFELAVEAASPAASAAPLAFEAPAAGPAPSADDPFADLLAGLAPAAPRAAAAATAPVSATPDAGLFPNPLEAAGGRGGSAVDPFADLLGSSPAAAPRRSGSLDDFSDLGLAAAGASTSIDDLFGTGKATGGDPLALSPLADPLHQPNTAGNADPLAALQGKARPSAPTRSDHVPIGQFGYTPPKASTPQAAPSLLDDLGDFGDLAGLGAAPAAAPAPVATPQFDDMTGEMISPAPVAPPPVVVPPPVRAPVAPVAAPAAAAATPATQDALMAAFLRGVGSTHQMPQALTPELMERVGVLLRSSTEGTLHLLHTRQELKREVRAEVTMIAAQANNPLKFSPTVEVALAHLLGPGVRGFMAPEAAMRDAYDDLRAHEFGVMVGMRAALAHVLARFTPEELEKKIAAKSALDSLFAANRKAKLWDQFVALYAGIASEAEDDFHSLFGKAFLKAYDEQMARLKSGR